MKVSITSSDSPSNRFLEVEQGSFVFKEDDIGTEMFIIHEGEVEILHLGAERELQIAVLERGDFFGEMALLEDLPRSASARALKALKLIRIDGSTFDRMLRDNPEISVRIMRKLCRRLRDTDRLLKGEPELPPEASPPVDLEPSRHSLVHRESGIGFPVHRDAASAVGRRDPVTGIQPEIDLSSVDPERSSSRKHAKLFWEDGGFFVVEDIGTTNGTFVNDVRLRAGVPTPISPGDTLRFGLVDLDFHRE